MADRNVALCYLSLGFAAAAVSTPVLVTRHTFPLPAFHQEWVAFALGLAAVGCLVLHPAIRQPAIARIALVPAILLVAIIAQAALGRLAYVEQALIACLYLLWLAALIWCAGVLRETLGLARVGECLAAAIAAAALVSAVIAIHGQLSGTVAPDALAPALRPTRAYANFNQPNLFADYLCLGLASLALLAARGRLLYPLLAAVAAPLLFALALSQSRSAWVFLALLLVVSLWLAHQSKASPRSYRPVVVSLGYLFGLLLAHLLANALDRTPLPVDERLFRTAEGIVARLELWSQAWEIFLRAPWFGAGFGQFAYERFWTMRPAEHAASLGLYTHAHNIILQFLAEFGMLATLPLIWLLLRWVIDTVRAARDPEHAWLLAVAGVLCLHSLIEFPLWYANFLVIAGLVLGLGDLSAWHLRLRSGPLLLGGATALGVVTLVTSYGAYRGLERLFVGPQGHALPSVLVQESQRIETRSLFVPYVELAYSGLLRIEPGDVREALTLNARVLRFLPDDHVAYRHALLLAQAGESESARALALRAAAIYPAYVARFMSVLERLALEQPAIFESMRVEVLKASPR